MIIKKAFNIKLRIPDFPVNPSIPKTSQVMINADITRPKTVSKEVLNNPILESFAKKLEDDDVVDENLEINKMERMEKTKDNKKVMVNEGHTFS